MYKRYRVIKIAYNELDNTYDETIVSLYLLDENGNKFLLYVTGTEPRFWTKSSPWSVNIPSELKKYIIAWYSSGTDVDNNKLYCIKVTHPKIVAKLRDYFEWTGRSNIPYDRTVRYLYGWKNYVAIADEYIKQKVIPYAKVKPVSEPEIPYPYKKCYIDIENDDTKFGNPENPEMEIYCTSMLINNTIYYIYTGVLDENKVKEYWNSKFILENILKTGDITKLFFIDTMNIIFVHCNTETEIFKNINIILSNEKPSMISGWNIEEYDIEYLNARANFISKNEIKLNGIAIFDLITAYGILKDDTVASFGKHSLDFVSNEYLEFGKLPRQKIQYMYNNESTNLCIYNMFDVYLCKLIDDTIKLTDFFSKVSDICNVTIEQSFHATYLGESVCLHFYGDTFIPKTRIKGICPNCHEDISNTMDYKKKRQCPYCDYIFTQKVHGALTEFFKTGFMYYVIDIDLSSEYPSVIMVLNCDVNTKIRNDNIDNTRKFSVAVSGRKYYTDVISPIASKLKELISYRSELKKELKLSKDGTSEYRTLKERDDVIKGVINGLYGLFGTEDWLYYDPEIANDITEGGKENLMWNYKLLDNRVISLNEHKYTCEVINLETDAAKCLITSNDNTEITEDILEQIGKILINILNSSYDDFAKKTFHVEKQCFSVKVENIYWKFLHWGKKKRYVYMKYNGKIKYVGLEVKRSNAALITKKLQTAILEEYFISENKETVYQIIKNTINALMNKEIDNETCTIERIHTTGNNLYSNMIKTNLQYGTNMKLNDSVAVYYEGTHQRVIPFDSKPSDYHININYEKVVEVHIWNKLNDMLKTINIDISGILSNSRKGTIMEC